MDSLDITEPRIQTTIHCCICPAQGPRHRSRFLSTTPGSLSEREEAWDDEEESRGDTGIWCLSACHCLPTEIFKL